MFAIYREPNYTSRMDALTENRQAAATRIEALDQFRGFAIVAMTIVNFLAGVRAVPA